MNAESGKQKTAIDLPKLDMAKNRKRNSEQLERILDGAENLFSKKGYHPTTLRDISREIGLSTGNIYYYINSKEEILYLLHERLGGINDTTHAAILRSENDSAEKLLQMIKSEFDVMRKYEDLIMIIYHEGYVLRPEYMKKILEREREHVALFEKVINEGISKGIFNECNVRVVANQIKLLVDGWILKRWDMRKVISAEEYLSNATNMILKSLEKKSSSQKGEQTITSKNKICVVTNSVSPIGRHVSIKLLQQGFSLVAHGSDAKALNRFLKELNSLGMEAKPVLSKLSNEQEIKAFLSEIEEHSKRIDLFVHVTDLNLRENTPNHPDNWYLNLTKRSNEIIEIFTSVAGLMKSQQDGKMILIVDPHENRYETLNSKSTADVMVTTFVKALADDLSHTSISFNALVPKLSAKIESASTNTTPKDDERILFLPVSKTNYDNIIGILDCITRMGSNALSGETIHIGG